jgi:hypothetical protein
MWQKAHASLLFLALQVLWSTEDDSVLRAILFKAVWVLKGNKCVLKAGRQEWGDAHSRPCFWGGQKDSRCYKCPRRI